MKKGWIIALCVLLLLGAGAGYGYYRLHGAALEAEQTQTALYEQYQAMLQNAEQTTLTVTENGETAGTYTLLQLGLLEATEQAIAAGFTADERMDPAVFAQKSMADKLQWRSQAHTQPGPVRVDTVRYTDEAVVSDLEALPRHPAQRFRLAHRIADVEAQQEFILPSASQFTVPVQQGVQFLLKARARFRRHAEETFFRPALPAPFHFFR